MIRVVMFDLGMTLIDQDYDPFPHVMDAIAVISDLKIADGAKLNCCLISDFKMATPPVTTAKINSIFNEYLVILDQTGLRPFFEPVSQRVTLSTHAGVLKPNRQIFERALDRLGARVPLEECLFVTEEASHIEAARRIFHMKALQFRSTGSLQFDFDDWSKAPALIANFLLD
jgi:beta-phosphoglucomutase-like phosphatase (HAD superfamily)